MIDKLPLTEKDMYVLTELRKAGYGWRKYAESVMSQGCISEKQQQTACAMLEKFRWQQCKVKRRQTWNSSCYSDDISDSEAMSLREYF